MAKEKQQDIKKDKVSTPDETPCLEDNWKENSYLPSGWMANILVWNGYPLPEQNSTKKIQNPEGFLED